MSEKYDNRTPDSIDKEWQCYTYEGVQDLADYLENWNQNETNNRQYVKMFNDLKKDGLRPDRIAAALFCHALDWFQYGN